MNISHPLNANRSTLHASKRRLRRVRPDELRPPDFVVERAPDLVNLYIAKKIQNDGARADATESRKEPLREDAECGANVKDVVKKIKKKIRHKPHNHGCGETLPRGANRGS